MRPAKLLRKREPAASHAPLRRKYVELKTALHPRCRTLLLRALNNSSLLINRQAHPKGLKDSMDAGDGTRLAILALRASVMAPPRLTLSS
jgi:hypothetical protein